MDDYINRAAARRAAKSRRKIGSKVSTVPTHKLSNACPMRLMAVGKEEILQLTWMECLVSIRAQLEEARFGGESAHRLEAACALLGLMARVFRTTSIGYPCCEAASKTHSPMAQCGEDLHLLELETLTVLEKTGDSMGEAFSRLTSILHRPPRPELIAEIAVDLGVPWCPCEICLRSYVFGPRILSCRHCHTIMALESRRPQTD